MATQRGYYRAELLRAINNLDMALTHLVRLGEAYAKAHPEIASMIDQICDGLVMISDTVKKLHDSI